MTLLPNEKDPRVIRTRSLIQDAFLELYKDKDFNHITVRDITERATVNRTTFYDHFQDKYELLESIVSNAFMNCVSKRIQSKMDLTEDTIRNLILAVCDYHESLSNSCKGNYQSVATLVEAKVQFQLKDLVVNILENNLNLASQNRRKLELIAIMISGSIYGATYHWHTEGQLTKASVFLEEIVPFIMAGINEIC